MQETAALADTDRAVHSHGSEGYFEFLFRLIFAFACMGAIWFELPDASPPILVIGREIYLPFSYYGVVGLLIAGWPIFSEAWENLRERRMTMELSMSLAIAAGAFSGYFLVCLVIVVFVLIAERIEHLTLERGRRAIRELLQDLPQSVFLKNHDGGGYEDVEASRVRPGNVVLVRPGSLVPVDGIVVSGHSFIEEARITGEAIPAEKFVGSLVYAGTLNQAGSMEVEVTAIGGDTSYGHIIHAVETAQAQRSPMQRLADRVASYIVYAAFALACLQYWYSGDLVQASSVILVAGACGIAAGTPLAVLGGLGRAARLDVIVKGGIYLEQLGIIDTIILDKTGTVTWGLPRIAKVTPLSDLGEREILGLAGTAELRSEHPVGRAIVGYAQQLGHRLTKVDQFSYRPGFGIEASSSQSDSILIGNRHWMAMNAVELNVSADEAPAGHTRIYVASEATAIAAIDLTDEIKDDARQFVRECLARKIEVHLLSGDKEDATRDVARDLGIAHVRGSMTPFDKREFIQYLRDQGRKVAMVGDGINDAPALLAANVGVSLASGTDVARESADVVLIGSNLTKLIDVIDVSRRVRRIVWFNFAGTILIDVAGVLAIFAGFVGPMSAALIHTGSELAFILNSARLLPARALTGWRFHQRKPSSPIADEEQKLTHARSVSP
ncbi:cation-translocating P-type ATPase [Rhizobium pusense]|uniref:heavy metal translocating P-type ATPase n=1 Tax=Agrobacterium pusense TaxID=648995 RepID=UPI002448011E|nr:cation-translocating P-type ATPase [Agrobacterium pusense]MDH1270475.1 cation-translocating P-type ATPase [Agrobacterium pusense]